MSSKKVECVVKSVRYWLNAKSLWGMGKRYQGYESWNEKKNGGVNGKG